MCGGQSKQRAARVARLPGDHLWSPPNPCLACHGFLSSSTGLEGWESLLSRGLQPPLWVIPALDMQDPAACLSLPRAHVCQHVC